MQEMSSSKNAGAGVGENPSGAADERDARARQGAADAGLTNIPFVPPPSRGRSIEALSRWPIVKKVPGVSDEMAGTPRLLNGLAAVWAEIDEPGFRLSIKQNIVPDVDTFHVQAAHDRRRPASADGTIGSESATTDQHCVPHGGAATVPGPGVRRSRRRQRFHLYRWTTTWRRRPWWSTRPR